MQPDYPRLAASASMAREPQCCVCLTTMGNVWLVNRTASALDITAGELFGFNVGSYVEIPSGMGFPQGFVYLCNLLVQVSLPYWDKPLNPGEPCSYSRLGNGDFAMVPFG